MSAAAPAWQGGRRDEALPFITQGSVLCVASFVIGVLVAQGARHPNLRAAQQLVDQAFQRISDAQRANEWDMGGHAARAKDLLAQASREIKLATEEANHHH